MLLLCFSQKFALVFEFKYFSRYYCIPCPSKIVIVVLLVLTVQCSILAASFLFSHTRGRGLVLLAQFMFSGFGAISHDKVFEHCSSNWFPLLTHTQHCHYRVALAVFLAGSNVHLGSAKSESSTKLFPILHFVFFIGQGESAPSAFKDGLRSPGRIRSLRQNESINNITDKTDDNKRRQTGAAGASVTR